MTREEAIENIKSLKQFVVGREWNTALNIAIEALQEPEGKWIPVSERLPEEDGQYWITENWGGRRTCLVHFVAKHHISFEEFLEAFEIDAVAWKPAILPEPYKAGEQECE